MSDSARLPMLKQELHQCPGCFAMVLYWIDPARPDLPLGLCLHCQIDGPIRCDIPINRAPWCDCWRIHTDHEGPPTIECSYCATKENLVECHCVDPHWICRACDLEVNKKAAHLADALEELI